MQRTRLAAAIVLLAALMACTPEPSAEPPTPVASPVGVPLDPARGSGLPPAVGSDVIELDEDGDLVVHHLGDR